jgi:hypothetical protein
MGEHLASCRVPSRGGGMMLGGYPHGGRVAGFPRKKREGLLQGSFQGGRHVAAVPSGGQAFCRVPIRGAGLLQGSLMARGQIC